MCHNEKLFSFCFIYSYIQYYMSVTDADRFGENYIHEYWLKEILSKLLNFQDTGTSYDSV